MISYTFTPGQLGAAQGALERLSKTVGDLRDVLGNIGAYIVSSTQKRFTTQTAPDGSAWIPSLRARLEGGQTLLDSGALRGSIAMIAGRDSVEVGSNRIYAAVHQLGATISARNVPFLRFQVGGHFVSKKSVTIPARPYLGLDARDEREIETIAVAALEEAQSGKPLPGEASS